MSAGGEGAAVLDAVEEFVSRYVAHPGEHERAAHVLWIAHTWFMECWDVTPRLAFLSPEPGSGKSRALEVTAPLVPRPVHTVSATPAYLIRRVGAPEGPPTVLFDEVDTVFGPRAKDNEELRALLNAGYVRGAVAGRCVVRGREVFTEELPAFSAVALAGLDDLPDTLMHRSVVVRMRRRGPHERVAPWRLREGQAGGIALHDRLEAWAQIVAGAMAGARPVMPSGVEDRAADIWEPLLSVADVAGGVWPARACAAAVAMVARAQAQPLTLGVRLLEDLRAVFGAAGVDRLATADVVAGLVALEESPWGDLRGKALDARSLARRLARYDVGPRTLREGSRTFKGYDARDLTDPWARYLPPVSAGSVTTVTPTQRPVGRDGVADVMGAPEGSDVPRDGVTAVTVDPGHGAGEDSGEDGDAVTDVTAGWDETQMMPFDLPAPDRPACRDCGTAVPTGRRRCIPCGARAAVAAVASVGAP